MQRIKRFFTGVKALGAFGLILVICVGLIVASTLAFNIVWADSDYSYNAITKLMLLEDDLSYSIVNQNIEENYYVYSEGENAEEPLESFNEARVGVNSALDELQDDMEYELSDKEFALVGDISDAQQAYVTAFEGIKRIFNTQGRTWEDVEAQQAVAEQESGRLRNALQELIHEIEAARQTERQTIADDLQSTVRIGVISLILLPFLAIWAFGLASRVTQPVLTLTQAATAIAGDRFRAEELDEIHDRRDGLGQLARSLEHLAQTSQTREAELEAEINNLREQLHETRRRKFVPVSSPRDAEGA
jgi:HAMP domain-containing protein